MRRLPLILVVFALGFSFTTKVRADDAKKTPEQIKAEKKDKDLQKAKDDLEKELKPKKVDPEPAKRFLEKLAMQVGLEVADSKKMVHDIMGKKIPWDQASNASDEKVRAAVDTKTNKIDLKKFQTEFAKWISTWKPEPPKTPGAAPPAAPPTPAPAPAPAPPAPNPPGK
jgi:hypothetical protein